MGECQSKPKPQAIERYFVHAEGGAAVSCIETYATARGTKQGIVLRTLPHGTSVVAFDKARGRAKLAGAGACLHKFPRRQLRHRSRCETAAVAGADAPSMPHTGVPGGTRRLQGL